MTSNIRFAFRRYFRSHRIKRSSLLLNSAIVRLMVVWVLCAQKIKCHFRFIVAINRFAVALNLSEECLGACMRVRVFDHRINGRICRILTIYENTNFQPKVNDLERTKMQSDGTAASMVVDIMKIDANHVAVQTTQPNDVSSSEKGRKIFHDKTNFVRAAAAAAATSESNAHSNSIKTQQLLSTRICNKTRVRSLARLFIRSSALKRNRARTKRKNKRISKLCVRFSLRPFAFRRANDSKSLLPFWSSPFREQFLRCAPASRANDNENVVSKIIFIFIFVFFGEMKTMRRRHWHRHRRRWCCCRSRLEDFRFWRRRHRLARRSFALKSFSVDEKTVCNFLSFVASCDQNKWNIVIQRQMRWDERFSSCSGGNEWRLLDGGEMWECGSIENRVTT